MIKMFFALRVHWTTTENELKGALKDILLTNQCFFQQLKINVASNYSINNENW